MADRGPSGDTGAPWSGVQGESRAPHYLGEPPATSPNRIVSLAPNVTEILFALGVGDRVVGVTRFCDHPPEAASRSKVGGFLDPSLEAIAALEPDLLIAVPNGQARNVVERLVDMGFTALVTYAYGLTDVGRTVVAIGRAVGAEKEAHALVSRIDSEISAVRAEVRGRPPVRVLFLYGHRPLVAAGAGSYADALIEIAGGVNVVAKGPTRYPTLSLEAVIGLAPEVIIDAYDAGHGARAPSDLEGMEALPAVRAGRVHALSANAALRPGPRAGADARMVARLLHQGDRPSESREERPDAQRGPHSRSGSR